MRGMLVPLAGMLVAAAPGAAAQDWRDREVRSIRVDASALDLSTAAGVDELERRVGRAVDRICGGDRACRDEAWASADDQVRYAIARDEWTRRLASERAAELAACGGECAPPEPAYAEPAYARPAYYAPPPPPPPAMGGVTVTIIYAAPAPPPQVYYYQAPPHPAGRGYR